MNQALEDVPPRLRRAEMVLGKRTDQLLLVLDQVCDIHNIRAVMRTADSLGLQHVWTVKPPYVKNLAADELNVRDKECPESVPPQAQIVGQLHIYLREHKRGIPSYTIENLAPKGCGDLWRATCTLEDGRTVVGKHDFSKKMAMRYAASEAMKLVNPEYKESSNDVRIVEYEPVQKTVKKAKIEKFENSTSVSKGADRWLTVKEFETSSACLQQLKEEGWTIWATALCEGAVELTRSLSPAVIPDRLAIVVGSEGAGVSQPLLEGSDLMVYLPMYGFTESLNLSVATGLVVQRLLDICDTRGNMSTEEKNLVRKVWWDQLAPTSAARERYQAFAALFEASEVLPLRDPREMREASAPKAVKRHHPNSTAQGQSISLLQLSVGVGIGLLASRLLVRQ
ncbi:hypothetical protein DIPPA_70123 [Diplonema papillatum]|nr:hypothetical protein DIPPA_70123 [Diplonema papillatum]